MDGQSAAIVADTGPEDEPDTNVNDAANDAGGESEESPRDFEAEARAAGWRPIEDFLGDKSKFVDAKTFVERKDIVMPFLKKENKALKREIDDLKRTIKRSSEFFSKAEERAYERALNDLQTQHDEAVDKGDVPGARKVLKAISELEKPQPIEVPEDKKPDDPQQARKEFAAWIEDNDWYVTDDKKRAYADIQAGAMGPATDWPDGSKAWLDELGRRVANKFADKPVNPANPGGNRSNGAQRGAKTFADLPPEARAQADKFHRQGVFGQVTLEEARKRYVKDYPW